MNNVLVFTLSLTLFAGCSLFGGDPTDPLAGLREQIAESVIDQGRATAMLASVDEIDALLVETAGILAAAVKTERALFIDYDSTPEDFRRQIADSANMRRDLQKQMLDAHLAMKAEATSDEWDVIRPVALAAVASRIDALVGAALDRS